MSFQIKSSTASATIHQVIMLIIDQLNEHEKKVFAEARTKENYTDLLRAHPVIVAAFKARKD